MILSEKLANFCAISHEIARITGIVREWDFTIKKYSDQLSTTALVRRNATKNLENSCFVLNQLY